MSSAVRLSNEILHHAKTVGRTESRTVPGQIEHWARIGKCAEENPDLPFSLARDILLGKAELEAGQRTPYQSGPAAPRQ